MPQYNFKQTAQRILAVSLLGAAALGIYALFGPRLHAPFWRLLLTSGFLAAASTLCIPCTVQLERGRRRLAAASGIAASVLLLLLILWMIWLVKDVDHVYEPMLQIATSLVILAVALSHSCLVNLAKLADRHRWIQLMCDLLIVLLATRLIIIIWIWNNLHHSGWRYITLLAILLGTATLMVPILQRIGRSAEEDPPIEETRREGSITCPGCGELQPYVIHGLVGEVTCPQCAMRCFVKVWQPPR